MEPDPKFEMEFELAEKEGEIIHAQRSPVK
jgi:hypothetical protein